jgi:hypothetical protein
MVGGIGKMTAVLAAVHNENTLALANLNFDFSLVKLEAPIEFTSLGQTISKKRKMEAEEGTLHKTARGLAALFGSMLPDTEDLFRTYGTRVTEISSMPAINPREGTEREGIFASHVGVDTASIICGHSIDSLSPSYVEVASCCRSFSLPSFLVVIEESNYKAFQCAAVASGSAAIAVHLLACMLAGCSQVLKPYQYGLKSSRNKTIYSIENKHTLVFTRASISNFSYATRHHSYRPRELGRFRPSIAAKCRSSQGSATQTNHAHPEQR